MLNFSSMPEVKRAGLQRVRVGLTGLGAVLLIVAISAAIFESASQRSDGVTDLNRTEAVVNMVGNDADTPAEPLAEMGITPGAPSSPDGTKTSPAK